MTHERRAERQSLRGFLARLEAQGELLRIAEPVDPRFEVSAVLERVWDGPAVLFEFLEGSKLKLIGNVLNSETRFAHGLGVPRADLQSRIVDSIEHPLPSRLVKSGPCQEVAVEAPDLALLPIPHFFEGESGPYITAGAIVAEDSASKARNLSFARLKPLGGNRAFIGIAPNHHLAQLARAAAARGESLPIAVTIGNHPAVLTAAALYLGLGDDELEVAGALLGEPVEVVRCRTSALQVPAHCEIVLEGTLDAGELIEEGPVSEFHGLYETYGKGQVVTFQRMTRRRDAIYQAIQPGYHPEHVLIGGIAIAAGLARHLRRSIPCLHRVAVGLGGAGRLHAVVSLREPRPGDARKAMFAIWGAVNLDQAGDRGGRGHRHRRSASGRMGGGHPHEGRSRSGGRAGGAGRSVGTAGTGWAGRQARHRCHEARRGPRGLDKGRPARRGHGKGAASAGEWTDIRARAGSGQLNSS